MPLCSFPRTDFIDNDYKYSIHLEHLLPRLPRHAFSSKDILAYDVCVIGGGAARTYAAIRLRDLNKTVAVVETQDRLGGHTVTYTHNPLA